MTSIDIESLTQAIPEVFPPLIAAFVVSVIALPPFIKFLKDKQIQQYLREEGPQSHAHKAKTPTAGGVCLIASFAIVLLATALIEHIGFIPGEIAVVLVSLACGALGWIDDSAKIRRKSNDGISAKSRLIAEAVFGASIGIALLFGNSSDFPYIVIPQTAFFAGSHLSLPPVIFVGYAAFLMAATSNALNLHDGMDGLAAGTSSMVLATMAAIFFASHAIVLALIASTACGAILGFLVFNKNPAKIFMGDTGSLFLGGLIAGLTLASGQLLLFLLIGLIYIAETISVMSQVSYFKLTKPYTPSVPMSPLKLAIYKLRHKLPGEGKRLFRMAPLHHHYEAVLAEKGVPEWQVVARFWGVEALLCATALALYFIH